MTATSCIWRFVSATCLFETITVDRQFGPQKYAEGPHRVRGRSAFCTRRVRKSVRGRSRGSWGFHRHLWTTSMAQSVRGRSVRASPRTMTRKRAVEGLNGNLIWRMVYAEGPLCCPPPLFLPWNSRSVRGRSVLASCAVVNPLLCTQKVRSRRCHIESAYTLLAGVVGQ